MGLFGNKDKVNKDYGDQATKLSSIFSPENSSAYKEVQNNTAKMEQQIRQDSKTNGAINAQKSAELAARSGLTGTMLQSATAGVLKTASDDALKAITTMNKAQSDRLSQILEGIDAGKMNVLTQNEKERLSQLQNLKSPGDALIAMLIGAGIEGATGLATGGPAGLAAGLAKGAVSGATGYLGMNQPAQAKQ